MLPGPGKEPGGHEVAESCIRKWDQILECLGLTVLWKTDWVKGPKMRLKPLLCSLLAG